MSRNTWIIFAVVVIAVLGGLVYASQSNKIDVSNVDVNKIQNASEQNGQIGDHVFGNKDSKVTLIEYGDFQCPGCKAAEPNLREISETYKDDMAFVFRNFPLTTIHPNARAASAAAEAAGSLGKYWEMHTALYSNQDAWKDATGTSRTDIFVDYARTIGLNEDKFREALEKSSINKKISFDQALGKQAKVTSTPTLFLNGEQLSEDVLNNVLQGDGSELTKLIDSKLK